jgi:cyclophilin family peptidyl-prolyl cis-trans isomerase
MKQGTIIIIVITLGVLAGIYYLSNVDSSSSASATVATNQTTGDPYATSTAGAPIVSDVSVAPADSAASTSLTVSITTKPTKNLMHTITIETNKGTIVFETYDADAPLAAANFVKLATAGFYNGVVFHRVIKGFMIQGGDPTGTGRGGPGYTFADELSETTPSAQAGYTRGTVAMANSGPDTNGSQFFIMHQDYPLPHNYTIFGKVISGMDVVDAIANSAVDGNDKPVDTVTMKKVTVTENK